MCAFVLWIRMNIYKHKGKPSHMKVASKEGKSSTIAKKTNGFKWNDLRKDGQGNY